MLRNGGPAIACLAAAAVAATSNGSARGTQHAARWCQARPSESWQRILAHHIVPLSRTIALNPMALANGGRSFFTEIFTKRFTGVAEIVAKTGAVTRIKAFPDPTPAVGAENGDQAWGGFDGRWLVWKEFRGQTSFNRFTVWAWDSRTRKVRRIGAAQRGPNGEFWDSPWQGVQVRGGIAVWVQGVGPDQRAEVHAYNLRTGRDTVVRNGHPANAFLLRHHVVVWFEASAPGTPTGIRAASALTGATVAVPPALRGVHDAFGFATDGLRIAYPDAAYKSLWWSASPARLPHEIVDAQGPNHIDNSVQIGGRYLGFGIEPRVFLADTKARRYVQVSARGGFMLLDESSLLVVYASGSKLDPINEIVLIRQRDLPRVPACR